MRMRRSLLAPLPWTNFVVVTVITAVTAAASLVAEDLLPKGAGDTSLVVWSRVVALLALLGVLWAVLSLRSRVHRTTGTLFHVQVLDEPMKDLRTASRQDAEKNRMAVRSVTRWVDLRHRKNAHGVVELADVCRDVSDILEAQINADPIDTGYTLAPVMPWPVALAVGTHLPLPDKLRLLELRDSNGNPTNEIELSQPAREVKVEELIVGGDNPNGRIGVWIAVTGASRLFDPDRWPQFGVTKGYQVTLNGGLPDRQVTLSDHDVSGLGAAIADELVKIKKRNPTRELVVVAMVTKIVALATGWHLAKQECRFFHGTHLLHYDRDSDSYFPLRVKESQPPHAPGASGA